MSGKEDFRQALIAGIRSSGKNQSDVAKELGVSPQTVSKWVRNSAVPLTKSIGPLAQALGLNENEFVSLFLAALADGAGRPSSPVPQELYVDPRSEIQALRSLSEDLIRRIEALESQLGLS